MSSWLPADGLVLVAAALWGTGGLFIRRAGLAPETIAFFRMAVPVVVIGAMFIARSHRISRDGLPLRLLASILNAIRMYFYFLAFTYTSVATAVVTLYTWPIFATLFARPINGEAISRARLGYLGLAFSGVVILYLGADPGQGSTVVARDLIGISSMMLSAVIYALSVVLFKRARSGGSSFETPFFQNLVGAFAFGVLFLVERPNVLPAQVAWATSLGLVGGLAGFTLFFIAVHHISTARASNLAFFEVPVAVLVGTVVLGEPLRVTTVIGGVVICYAVIASRRVA